MPHSEHRAGAHGSSSLSGQDGGSSNSSKGAVWGWGLGGFPVLPVVLHLGWAGTLQGAECWDVNLHSMRYLEIGMTDSGPEQPWFFEVGYVDGEIFVHYNSSGRRYVPCTEWMKAPGAVDPEYWDRNTRIVQSNEQINRATTRPAVSMAGSHRWQRM
uniref:MHC class I-like antigen recognition-like domain-containing protein n=1 Tax=Coturnix japonica TaxID=93934 RepID=A0A8C2TYM8_COTJA